MIGTWSGRRNAGVTLIEICVAVGILAFCFVPIIQWQNQNMRETHVSQEDLLARHFLMDMVEAFKGEPMRILKALPSAEVPVAPGADDPGITKSPLLRELDMQIDELRQKAAASLGGTDAEAVKGMQTYLDIRKSIKLSRLAIFRPGPEDAAKQVTVNELVCIVRWMSTISNSERRLEYSKIIVRPVGS